MSIEMREDRIQLLAQEIERLQKSIDADRARARQIDMSETEGGTPEDE
jgi:hypothetical protein